MTEGSMASSYELITLRDPLCRTSEAYRILRSNLLLENKVKPIRTLLVTSAGHEDSGGNLHHLSGEILEHINSIVVANVAVVLAQSFRKTLIVDSDLRTPWQHEIWKQPNEPGLMNMMASRGHISLCKPEVDNLWLLPSGVPPSDPQIIFDSPRIGEVIGKLKDQADIIVFDSAPVTTTIEPLLLASMVDAVLLVVNASTSRTESVREAKKLLVHQNARLLGAVLANASENRETATYSHKWEV